MRIKKYGYSEFRESEELKFAIVVPLINYEKHITTWQFVTSIDFTSKRWNAKNHEKAYLFNSRKSAQDFVLSMCCAGTGCFVVEVLEGFIPTNNW